MLSSVEAWWTSLCAEAYLLMSEPEFTELTEFKTG